MQKIFSLLLALMLVFSLSACGATGTTASGDDDNLGDGAIERGLDDLGDMGEDLFDRDQETKDKAYNRAREDAGDNTFGSGDERTRQTDGTYADSGNNDTTGAASYDTQNPANGTAQTDGTSYDHMLDNGRVHDTDGDLTDGENSNW